MRGEPTKQWLRGDEKNSQGYTQYYFFSPPARERMIQVVSDTPVAQKKNTTPP